MHCIRKTTATHRPTERRGSGRCRLDASPSLYAYYRLMRNKKILYVSQEITPYLKDSEMGDMLQKLPQKVQEKGFEVRAFMPKYGCINERRHQLHEVIRLSGANISIDDNDHPLILKVATLQASRMQVYFIDNDDFFQRHAMKDIEIRETPADNDERMMFFTRGTLDTVKKLRWEPAVMQCTGWISTLVPAYVKKHYAEDSTIGEAKIVFSLYNDRFDGTLDGRFVEKLLMDGFTDADLEALGAGESVDWMALNRIAIRHADGVMQMSPDVPEELVAYARELGKPFLPYQGEEIQAEPIIEFYKSF